MKYTEAFLQALNKFQEDPGSIHGPYWSSVIDILLECIRNKGDITAKIKENSDFLDFGICSEVAAGSEDSLRSFINDEDIHSYSLHVLTFTDWFCRLYNKILNGDRKEILEKEIHCIEIQRKKLLNEKSLLQQDRKAKILALLDEQTKHSKMRLIDDLVQMDDLIYSSLQAKKVIAHGKFFSVEEKRVHFDHEKKLQKEINWFNNFIDTQTDKNGIIEVHKIQEKINEVIALIIDKETIIEKMVVEMQGIEKIKQELSAGEIESRIRKEIEYLRDLLKLSAHRLRLATCPLITSGLKLFSFKKLRECLERIQEFDPEVFHNDRASHFGKPEVIILPGTGAAIYDWKNNSLIVPLVIPGDNPIVSIATGVIDYRIDVDEDRVMVHTYNQLAERKTIRSTIDLRAALTKDYITWMTSEYNGFRVLSKGVKDWFEHAIAPSRNEIFTPPEYQTFALSPAEFEEQIKKIEGCLTGELEKVDDNILWAGSVLLYQKGKFDISFELLRILLKHNPDFGIAWYNAGLIASKLMRKQDAIDAFTEYTNRWPQRWWARIARDHLRRLQAT